MERLNTKLQVDAPMDLLGIVASGLCAIHCVLWGLLPWIIDGIGLFLPFSSSLESYLGCIAIVIASWAWVHQLRNGGSRYSTALLALGIVCIIAAQGVELMEQEHGYPLVESKAVLNASHPVAALAANDRPPLLTQDVPVVGEPRDNHFPPVEPVLGILGGMFLLAGHLIRLSSRNCCDKITQTQIVSG